MNDKQESALRKIRACMALGENKSATDQERETALRQAQKLMLKYNISMFNLEQEQDVEGVTLKGPTIGRRDYTLGHFWWQRKLAVAVAPVFLCKVLLYENDADILMVGTEFNTEILTAVLDSVVAHAVHRKEVCYLEQAYRLTKPKFARSFYAGYADEFARKCGRIVQECQTHVAGDALVPEGYFDGQLEKVNDWVKNELTNVGKVVSSQADNLDMGALIVGMNEGERAPIREGVDE